MTQEEKQLLLKVLCAMLPYGLKVKCEKYPFPVTVLYAGNVDEVKFKETGGIEHIVLIKPYLRPMSSMTEEERKEYESFFSIGEYSCGGSLYGEEYEYIADNYDDVTQSAALIDWLIAHYFDYRGFISMGLALEAPKDMYKIK